MVGKEDSLRVSVLGSVALVSVHGRGSFSMGPSLKGFGASVIDRRDCTRLIVNMADCETMDSTFMGVLAGLAMRMKRECSGSLTMINLSEKTLSLLTTLGLNRVLTAFTSKDSLAEDTQFFDLDGKLAALEIATDDRKANVDTMLQAHEDLVAAAPENKARFEDVIQYLSRDAQEV